jgi:protein-L-isoaspartate O-methyltransferase
MMIPGDDRERLRQTFNQAADSYHRARPGYPGELFYDLIAVAGLAPGDRLLEIGCATGKATLPLARPGFHITCIELGPDLAAAARSNLRGLDADIIEGRSEDGDRPPGSRSTWSSPPPHGTGSILPAATPSPGAPCVPAAT